MNDDLNESRRVLWTEQDWFVFDGVWPSPDVAEQAGPGWWTTWMVYSVSAAGIFVLHSCGVLVLLLPHQCLVDRRKRMPALLLAVHLCLLPFGVLSSLCVIIPTLLRVSQPDSDTIRTLAKCVRPLDYIARVCLMAAYAFLLNIILKVARVNVGPKRLQNSLLLGAGFVVMSILYISVHFVIDKRTHLKYLILLPQLINVIAALSCCLVFIYKGFKIAQFMVDTNAMFYEIIAYEKLKREILERGSRRDLALCRLRRLTWHSEHDPSGYETLSTAQLAKRESVSSISDTVPGQRCHKDCLSGCGRLEQRIARPFCTAHQRSEQMASDKKARPLDLHCAGDSSHFSSSLEALTETPTTVVLSMEEALGADDDAEAGREWRTDCLASHLNKPIASLQQGDEGAELVRLHGGSGDRIREQDSKRPLFRSPTDQRECLPRDAVDRGYMADSELSSPSGSPSRPPAVVAPPSHIRAGVHEFPQQWLGLKKIKQGRLLSRILKSTYFSTLFLFIGSVFRLYDMFGVYGVLGNDEYVSPWPWLIFQTCDR